MAGYIPDQQQNTGSFLPTTEVLDVAQLYSVDVKSPEFKELLGRLFEIVNDVAVSVNTRDFAFYLNEELVDGQSWYNPLATTMLINQLNLRPNFRKVINFGPINAGVNTIAHGLTILASWKFTRIFGVANDNIGFNYYPLPWASAAGATNIELKVNATNVVITNNSGIVFTSCDVTLEYCKF